MNTFNYLFLDSYLNYCQLPLLSELNTLLDFTKYFKHSHSNFYQSLKESVFLKIKKSNYKLVFITKKLNNNFHRLNRVGNKRSQTKINSNNYYHLSNHWFTNLLNDISDIRNKKTNISVFQEIKLKINCFFDYCKNNNEWFVVPKSKLSEKLSNKIEIYKTGFHYYCDGNIKALGEIETGNQNYQLKLTEKLQLLNDQSKLQINMGITNLTNYLSKNLSKDLNKNIKFKNNEVTLNEEIKLNKGRGENKEIVLNFDFLKKEELNLKNHSIDLTTRTIKIKDDKETNKLENIKSCQTDKIGENKFKENVEKNKIIFQYINILDDYLKYMDENEFEDVYSLKTTFNYKK